LPQKPVAHKNNSKPPPLAWEILAVGKNDRRFSGNSSGVKFNGCCTIRVVHREWFI
jgi:hypothetical protein